jgi:hypothetical protein
MTLQDLSGGLPVEKESIVAEQPAEPFWAENLLFALYDPKADLGFWLHLGSVPNEWGMWEDRVLVCLPGDQGVLSMWGYYYTPQDRKPAGPNLAFRCVEPFKRWKVTFDGFAQHISNADMAKGLAPDGLRKRMVIDLDIECATPVWDAHTSAHSKGGKGEMTTQGWAKEHYEQLYRARGTVRVDDVRYEIDGTGWRDHSRGPRGGGTGEPWGGHVIAGCLFPSGRALIFSTYWRPDGKITLEGAAVQTAPGEFHHAAVLEPPRLRDLQMSGERLPIRLGWDGGEVNLILETRRSIWTSMQKRLAVGKDLDGPGLMYVLNFGPCEWDGEVGQVYIERSDPLNAPPEKIWAE